MRTPSGEAVSKLILAVFRLNGRLLAAGDRVVERFGLTSARWQVLGAIALSATPEPVARLARNMGLHRQGVQRIVDDLLAAKLVELRDNQHHRSAKLVVMTARGRKVYDSALAAQAPWVNALAEGLKAKDIAAARSILETLRDRLDDGERRPP